ncbi:MAG TPA: hypothetical protein DEG17_01290 [Cyanobacteria bacterium UBA11149]|nr:hypothetical protein [Cyanobacteria bacterium UBA11367]HBE58682.1 hypothetical protein [Cyanobacteria bacterium UBA11366]HBR74549.1 hypothetical protein [Cyanobacteria bacterium UBA11159]HBS68566.1 hypothetical protein [Cyanobacteria bacterium UBA11153]HBW87548.1 hypothetical protein [Cyanobacteria bacterium UBA11149]HCA95799.1 hypothetical protein [Cyanobacteria bacterium UBA9226]
MNIPDTPNPEIYSGELDAIFKAQVERLHQLTVYGRWLVVTILWLTLAPLSLWGWRYEISLLRSHFTWAAVRYGIIFNRLPFLGLSICVAVTAAVLVWHSRNILWGMPADEEKRLHQQVCRICQQGQSHPLWKWVCYVRET